MGAFKYPRPVNMIVMVNAIGFGLLFFYKKPYDPYVLLAGLSAILLIGLGFLLFGRLSWGTNTFF
jgi:hypothetical protein